MDKEYDHFVKILIISFMLLSNCLILRIAGKDPKTFCQSLILQNFLATRLPGWRTFCTSAFVYPELRVFRSVSSSIDPIGEKKITKKFQIVIICSLLL